MHFAIIKKNAPHTCYQEINKIKGKNSKDWDKKKRKKRDCQGRYEWVSDIYVAHSCVPVLKRSKESHLKLISGCIQNFILQQERNQNHSWIKSPLWKRQQMFLYIRCTFINFLRRAKFEESNIFKIKTVKKSFQRYAAHGLNLGIPAR